MKRRKTFLRACLRDYDELIEKDMGNKVHRVAHRLFKKGSFARQDFDVFLLNGVRLEDYAHAFTMLQEYCMCPS